MKSNTDIIRMALEILGVIGAGQAVEAEDHDRVLGVMSGTVATLDARHVGNFVAFFQANEIPDEFYMPVATLVARDASASYGFGGSDLMALQARGDDAEITIRAIYPSERGAQPVETEYF